MQHLNVPKHEAEPDAWYPLGPLQSGMLYDALRLGRGAGYDIEQLHLILDEEVRAAELIRAFQLVVGRHGALRSEFRWDINGVPQQRVIADTSMPVEVEDWSHLGDAQQQGRMAEFLANDRRQGFDLHRAPLMRLRLLRMGRERMEIVWTIHHILIDAISLRLVLNEVFALYEAPRLVAAMPEPPSFRAYVEWAAAVDREKSRAFFRSLLAFSPGALQLPGRMAKPSGPHASPATIGLRGDDQLLTRLHRLAARTQITVGSIVQAAWALVLARYSNERDVVYGATRACRYSPDVRGMDNVVGLVANALPVRVEIDDEVTVLDLLKGLRTQGLAIRSHEHTPLCEVERRTDGARAPLFDTTLTFQKWELNRALRGLGGTGWQRRRCVLHEQPVPLLNARVCEAETVEVDLVFDAARMEKTTVSRMGHALLFVLEQFAIDEMRVLGEVSVLSPSDLRTMVHTWNETQRPFSGDLLICEPFESRVAEQPAAIAVEHDGRRVTYRELECLANRIAHALQALGATPGQFVGVCVGRGIGLVAVLLGVAKSGAGYVPLDPRYPSARLNFMLSDSRAIGVVTEERFRSLFHDVHVVVVDNELALVGLPSIPPSGRAKSTDCCYAIYTSGTTGEPNGVVMSHRAVMNTLEWVNRTFNVGPGDRALFVTSPCFDLSVYDVFGILGAGATVVVATDAELCDFGELSLALRDRGITIWNSTPATLGAVMTSGSDDDGTYQLRLVLLSGDFIPVSMPDRLRARYPVARVVSLGGATEAAIWSNWYPIEDVDPEWPSIPYGFPIQNCRYHVLDSAMRPAPVGVAGDLHIGGACLADGYLNRPDLTAERFVLDPFSPGGNERLYKTGDRALYTEDGNLRLLGRSDSQIKIRGFRVELGEVEAAIHRLPGVKQGLAVAYSDATGEKALGAYVVTNGSSLDARRVRELLSEELPAFAVPSQITFLGALPVSRNGKIDRKALPAPSECLESVQRVAARTALEHRMVELWEEVLRKAPIGITDDFFALGGHSLLAIALLTRVEERFGWTVSLGQLIANPTIDGLITNKRTTGVEQEARLYLAFNTRGDRTPLVLLPGIYGSPFGFRELPRLLGPAQPVYLGRAFNAEGTPDVIVPSIERMAEAFLDELQTLCEANQLVVGGYSFGMLIAFELACLAEKRGIDVPLLVCLDGQAPGYPRFLPLGQRLLAHWREFSRGARQRYVADRLENTRRRLLRALGREYELTPRVQTASPEMKRIFKQVFETNVQASRNYAPRSTHSAAMLLFRAEVPERWVGVEPLDPYHGWQDFITGKIDVVPLSGNHATVLRPPNDRVIAGQLADYLARLRRERRESGIISGGTHGSVVTQRRAE